MRISFAARGERRRFDVKCETSRRVAAALRVTLLVIAQPEERKTMHVL